ncbi:MAG: phosphate ABC transporter permease PstA [Clostridia bacterium]|nr:phosphate ABC transporter permease PstA [Clostridia bacterium]
MTKELKENLYKYLFLVCAIFGIVAVAVIIFYLFARGMPAIFDIGFFKFIFGERWVPEAGLYGILPMIVNSLYAAAFSISIGVVLGVFSAVYLAMYCKGKLQAVLKQMVSLLSGIPSVVYGFFGMMVIIPFISDLTGTYGYGLFVSGIVLSIMILPTIILISFNSIKSVPKSYYEGALALGATHNQAVFKTILPAAKSGIIAGVILGINRAVGETMAIVMVSGNVPKIANSFFNPIRTLTGNIVLEMGYATGLHLDALIATGVVLFFFVLVIITCFNIYTNKSNNKQKEGGNKKTIKPIVDIHDNFSPKIKVSTKATNMLKILSYICISIAVLSLAFIIVFLFVRGVPYINLEFLFGHYIMDGRVTILPSLVTTLMLIVLTLAIALPLGVGGGIFLAEYTKKGNKFVGFLRSSIETLAGIPSIIFGLFGMLLFVTVFKLGFSVYAGALTMTLMILPTIIRTSEESFLAVPQSYREGSLALGAGKSRTIFKVVLPSAISGILTGIVLSMGRIVGESAPTLFTVGTAFAMPKGFASSGITLAVFMYILAGEAFHVNEAFAVAVVLIVMVITLNIISMVFENILKKKNRNALEN